MPSTSYPKLNTASYPALDADWIDQKIKDFNLNNSDVLEKAKNCGFSAEQILESANPVITGIIALVIQKIMQNVLVQQLSQNLQEKIRNKLDEYTVINSIASMLPASSAFEELKADILVELQDKNGQEADSQLQKLESLFATYEI